MKSKKSTSSDIDLSSLRERHLAAIRAFAHGREGLTWTTAEAVAVLDAVIYADVEHAALQEAIRGEREIAGTDFRGRLVFVSRPSTRKG